MGKFDIDGVTKTRFSSMADGEEWSRQIQQSLWYKSRLFINKIEIVLWIRLALYVLEKQMRTSKIANLFANNGAVENDALDTGSFKDFVMTAGEREQKHRTDMKEADFDIQKDIIKESKKDSVNLSFLFYALKNSVKYSYLIINGLILAFAIGIAGYFYNRAQLVAELNSKANGDIAHAWYERGQKTYESVVNECSEGVLMMFSGTMSNGYEFDMTLCVNDKNDDAYGAYVYDNLNSINQNIPPQNSADNYTDEEWAEGEESKDIEEGSSEYLCAALPLKGKVKGEFKPGKKILVDLNEYDSNNRKIGSFKGSGVIELGESYNSLRIEGTFKNHDGQKNKFTMSLRKLIAIKGFKEIVDDLQKRRGIRKVLHLHQGEHPYAIIVNKNKNIKMLQYEGTTADYENLADNFGPSYGEYDKNTVEVKDDCILIRYDYGGGVYKSGPDQETLAMGVKILDLRGDEPKTDVNISGVIWMDSIWENQNKFYVVDTESLPVIVYSYNQYGEIVNQDSLPIFHAYIPRPGIIKGEKFEKDSIDENFSFGPLLVKTYDFDGKEIDSHPAETYDSFGGD